MLEVHWWCTLALTALVPVGVGHVREGRRLIGILMILGGLLSATQTIMVSLWISPMPRQWWGRAAIAAALGGVVLSGATVFYRDRRRLLLLIHFACGACAWMFAGGLVFDALRTRPVDDGIVTGMLLGLSAASIWLVQLLLRG